MKVFRHGRHRAARCALLLGALAAFPGVAQASLGNATPATTSNRPDLRAIHILTGVNQGRVQFCFDKPISGALGAASSFRLGGYRWDTILYGGQAVLDSNTNCVNVLFPSADLANYTFGTVTAGAVAANVSGGAANLADSAPNLDSVAKAGTAGHTTGPDLQGVIVGAPAGNNEIIYQFDQQVDDNPAFLNQANFGYVTNNGTVVTAAGGAVPPQVDTTGFYVRVQFAGPVNGAKTAFVTRDNTNGMGAVQSKQSPGAPAGPATWNPIESVVVGGTSGITSAPTLAGAVLVSNNQIAYTFDQPIVTNSAFVGSFFARRFHAVASNGDETEGSTATVGSDGRTVLVTFDGTNGVNNGNLVNYTEQLVVASVTAGAVFNNNATASNPPSGVAVGDNAGGLGAGYSNGPDATRATFDGTTGQVTVQFDQRVISAATCNNNNNNNNPGPLNRPAAAVGGGPANCTPPNPYSFVLRGRDGSVVEHGASASVQTTAYQSAVTVRFSTPAIVQSVVREGGSLEIVGNQNSNGFPGTPNRYTPFAGISTSDSGTTTTAVFSAGDNTSATNGGHNAAGNVQQIVGNPPTAAQLLRGAHKLVFKPARHVKHHRTRKHSTKKHH